MDGTFEEHKSGYYTVQNVEENEWLNKKLENTNYGIYYSVKFQGAAETYLIQAKTEPVEGEKLYGHVEKSSSGKSWRFKKDKIPEGSPRPEGVKQITKNMVWKNLLQHFDVPSMTPDSKQWKIFWGLVDLHTDMLLPKPSGPKTLTVELIKETFTEEPEDLREWTKLHKGESDA